MLAFTDMSKAMAPPPAREPPPRDDKNTSAVPTAEPFRPLIRELQRLDDQNPVLAQQAVQLVALYQRLWESYVAKHAESSRLEKENRQLLNAHARLVDEKAHTERRCQGEEARSCHFQEAFRKVREGVIEVFEKWEDSKETAAAGGGSGEDAAPEKGNVAVVVPVVHVPEDKGTGTSQ